MRLETQVWYFSISIQFFFNWNECFFLLFGLWSRPNVACPYFSYELVSIWYKLNWYSYTKMYARVIACHVLFDCSPAIVSLIVLMKFCVIFDRCFFFVFDLQFHFELIIKYTFVFIMCMNRIGFSCNGNKIIIMILFSLWNYEIVMKSSRKININESDREAIETEKE